MTMGLYVSISLTNHYGSGATWWSNLELIQVAPHVGQISSQCKWRHLVAKLKQFKWRHLFGINESGTTSW